MPSTRSPSIPRAAGGVAGASRRGSGWGAMGCDGSGPEGSAPSSVDRRAVVVDRPAGRVGVARASTAPAVPGATPRLAPRCIARSSGSSPWCSSSCRRGRRSSAGSRFASGSMVITAPTFTRRSMGSSSIGMRGATRTSAAPTTGGKEARRPRGLMLFTRGTAPAGARRCTTISTSRCRRSSRRGEAARPWSRTSPDCLVSRCSRRPPAPAS